MRQSHLGRQFDPVTELIRRGELADDPGDNVVLHRGVGELGNRYVGWDDERRSEWAPHESGDDLVNDAVEEMGGFGPWWTANQATAEFYGDAGDDDGAVVSARFPREALKLGPRDSSGIIVQGSGQLEGVRVRRGGKWVTLPHNPREVPT